MKHGPPANERGGLSGAASQGLGSEKSQSTTTLEEISQHESESNRIDCWRRVGDAVHESITGALVHVSFEHAVPDAAKFRDRLLALADLNKLAVWAVRVHFERHRWEPDVGGRWAIVAVYCHEGEREVSDLVAFDVENSTVGKLTGAAWCLGVGALYDALHFNDGCIRVSTNIWTYVRDQGQSMLILDWNRAALTFMERGIRRVIAADVLEGRRIKQRLERAYRTPEIFVDEKERRA